MHLTASRKPAVNLIELCYDALWHYPIHRVAFLSQNHRNLSRATSVAKTGAFFGFQLPNLAGKEICWKIMQKGRNVKATGRLLGHLVLPQKTSWKQKNKTQAMPGQLRAISDEPENLPPKCGAIALKSLTCWRKMACLVGGFFTHATERPKTKKAPL